MPSEVEAAPTSARASSAFTRSSVIVALSFAIQLILPDGGTLLRRRSARPLPVYLGCTFSPATGRSGPGYPSQTGSHPMSDSIFDVASLCAAFQRTAAADPGSVALRTPGG